MAKLGEYVDDDVWPGFGMVILVDVGTCAAETMFGDGGFGDVPFGTIAASGVGWLRLLTSAGPYLVRLESHDAEPEVDLDGWEAAAEFPFRSATGSVGVGDVDSPPIDEALDLGGPAEFRVRVLRTHPPVPDEIADANDEPEEPGALTVQFWQAPPAPPRWLRHESEPSTGQRAADALQTAAHHDGPVTVATLADHVLATPDAVRDAVDWAVGNGTARIDGDLSGEFTFRRA
jgi:hypothetical protein